MNRTLPLITLSILWATAAGILAVGYGLSSKRKTIKQPTSDSAKQVFIDSVKTELDRLETLYRNHLSSLSDSEEGVKSANARIAARRLEWVFALCSLPLEEGFAPEYRQMGFSVSNLGRVRWMKPGRSEKASAWLFDKKPFLTEHQLGDEGFRTRDDAKYAYYWKIRYENRGLGQNKKRIKVLSVITIDRLKVIEIINKQISSKLRIEYQSLSKEVGLETLTDELGNSVFKGGRVQADRESDAIVPIKSVFGTWSLSSWHAISTEKFFDFRLFIAALAVGLLLFLSGIWVYRKLSNAVFIAEQRVSFVNSVSHELGTPLTTLMLNLDLAAEALEENKGSYELQLVTRAQEECSRLGRLIHNVLSFSKANKKGLDISLSKVDAGVVLDRVIASFRGILKRKEIEIEVEGCLSVPLLAHQDSLEQIFTNLFSNVEKYAQKDSVLRVVVNPKNEFMEFAIHNKGAAIPKELHEKIFEPYFRVNRTTTEGVSGTGIGLSISRELARGMKGDLVCQSGDSQVVFKLTILLWKEKT